MPPDSRPVPSHQLARCLSLTRAIGRTRSIEEVYSLALEELAQGLGGCRGSILLFDASGVMRFTAYRGLSERYRSAVEGHSPWLACDSDAEPIVVEDVETEPSLAQHLPSLRSEKIAALTFVPLLVRGSLIGKFVVYFDVPRAPGPEELQLAQVIASLVAFTVEHLRAEKQASEANRLKDEFLATLSHELRTPMNAVIGWVQMLSIGSLSPERTNQAIEVIGRNANRQAQLIDDLLDVSRIVSGKLEIGEEHISIARVVDNVVNGALPAAAAKRITLTRSIEGEPHVVGDAERLEQIVSNVVSNAIKFTPEGGRVDVRCGLSGASVEVEVKDTGVGIAPEFLPYVFDRFRQANSRTTREHGGLGLGLTIARHLVERHRGEMRAYSEGQGRGTRVTIRLPSAPRGARESALGTAREFASSKTLMDGSTVVVVDDQPDSREVLSALLEGWGAQVVQCENALATLDVLVRLRPQLLVADLAMPDIDGYDLMRRVRERDASLPAIAVSAYARNEDRSKALAAGFNGYCAKPIDVSQFLLAVREVTGRADPAHPR